ncbi:LysM peptidoglycan-binding domain-containing protein [Amycolatopsis anabasis]|uniref:LysM peptidoglycan-binding domain-containing protein n=1 Tax=Amycolatopsis anabasis TaxID=1840409 RepID=UPI00131E857C|nr:LysM peptidoglycan-binding domain-containing protein [Amycolatopsis anabasis]
MAVLVDEGLVGGGSATHATPRAGAPLRQVRRHPRAGELRRPPTRARVVAGRRPSPVADCAPRRLPVRWPWLAGLAVATGLVVAGLGAFANEMAPAVPAQTVTVPVGAGETLWDLAERFAPDSDPSAVVARIQELNGLGGAALTPGLPLTVPAQSR